MNSNISILVLLGAIFCISQVSGYKCSVPQPYTNDLRPINFNNFLGSWYILRATVQTSCLRKTLWRYSDTPANEVHGLVITKQNNALNYDPSLGTVEFLKGLRGKLGQIDNHWVFPHGDVTEDVVYIDSDNGQSWAIVSACFGTGNTTLQTIWSVWSRSIEINPIL